MTVTPTRAQRACFTETLPRRTSQMRKTSIRAVYVDLPPALSLAVRHAALAAGLTPEALIIDVLQDIFELVIPSQGNLALNGNPTEAA